MKQRMLNRLVRRTRSRMGQRVVLAVCATALASPVAAQQDMTRVTLTVSPTAVDFAGFGGSFGAAAAQLSVARFFNRSVGGELTAFAVLPLGAATMQPACIQGSACQSRSTPSMLNGLVIAPFAYLGETGLRASAGVGLVSAVGGEGFGSRSSGAASFALDWVPRGNSRFTPTLGVRLVRLATPVSGARQLVLPGVGLAF